MWNKFWTWFDTVSISPEMYGILIFGVALLYLGAEVHADPDLRARWHRLIATSLSKKYFAWFVITVFFWYDHFVWQYDGLSFESYLLFTAVVFGIDVWQKKIGLDKRGS